MKRTPCFLLAILFFSFLFTGCADNDWQELSVKEGIADQTYLFGMCYLLEERNASTLRIQEEVQLMKNMGVKTVRQWMHFSHFMSDPRTIKDREILHNMKALLKACEDAGMVNIGMNHHNFVTTRGKSSPTAKPFARDLSEGSEYIQWLNDYYVSWKTLVNEFPNIMYWEIDNEVNNSDFMRDAQGKDTYTVTQMAEIATDMFYYASRAIHEVNPNAKTIMGGLTEPKGLGQGNTANFLNMIYDNIESGEYGYFYGIESKDNASKNPDDYFQIACWHPYMSKWNKELFIEINNEYYQIILDREKKHKKVFFTEIGWNDEKVGGEDKAIRYMEEMYDAVKQMPYVETVNMFSLYEIGALNTWDSATYVRFGFFYDPDYTRTYPALSENSINIDENGNCISGAPKNKAYAYQRIAGGSGDLTLLVRD